jgi:outer membrane protein OmpA-like peptidoglycan-associated protein
MRIAHSRERRRSMKTRYLAWSLLFSLSCAAALAADKSGCRDPAWAPSRLPGFEIYECEDKPWMQVEFETTDGAKKVEGRRWTVTYELKDEKKNPTNETARRFYAEQGKKGGARLVSDPNGGWSAVLTQKTPQGELWYSYSHGSGNEESTGSYTLTTLQVAPLVQEVQVQATPTTLEADPKSCKDPGWLVRQFAAFRLARCAVRDFDTVTLDLPDGQKPVAGRVMENEYELTDMAKNPVPYAVWKNYVGALQGIGAKLVSDPNDVNRAVLTRKTPTGEYWYVYMHGSGNEESTTSYHLVTLLAGGPPPKKCTLAVYGVNFDFDKDTLRPDSTPVLEQVRLLFANDPAYSAEIGGHTDNQGARDYNMKLSARRADAVKAWMVAKGIAASRMTTAGYGDTRPLVPNTTDENKARNRRVELKRVGCRE